MQIERIVRFGSLFGLSIALLGCSRANRQPSTIVPIATNQPNQAASEGSIHDQDLLVDGENRHFSYYLPAKLDPAGAALIFMLHGGGGAGASAMNLTTQGRWNTLADQHGFIVVYPDGMNRRWNDCRADWDNPSTSDDVQFIRSLIDHFAQAYSIDQTRVYATGHSNGSMMALRLALELPDRIAAVVGSAGYMAQNSQCTAVGTPAPLMLVAGTADPVMPYAGGAIDIPGESKQGMVLSAEATIQLWLEMLGITTAPSISQLPDVYPADNSTVTINSYEDSLVRFYRIDGGGHNWPSLEQAARVNQRQNPQNRDFYAADAAWEFMQQHRLAK
ncbi:extracellular catalytic domain type 1 short-chain-length polyhydroxyalkanoate depolymerase [Herpetosiphon geysericola]|uniref:extracellular catalytic domain type 1 short-chain-length polyhydroxyalkanoate depolymerase n=1 Tax=Herpetosiphon geysericola TaxID=70996 RepID=UPI001364AE7A|nr:alpha/beta fold hydrolase [Herpetosiphon geysericola]